MSVAILSVGTELTRGELINSNAAWLAERLVELGFEVDEHITVADDVEQIVETVQRLAQRHRYIISTGGLGPTSDDLTTEAVAKAAGVGLFRDDSVVERIRVRFRQYGFEMPEENAKQGDFPVGAEIVPNPVGTAPGFRVDIGTATIFVLPGVPREMQTLFSETVAPSIADAADRRTHQVHLRSFGLTESGVAQRVADLEKQHEGITLGYRAHFPEIEVKVHARADTSQEAQRLAQRVAEQVQERLGIAVFGGRQDTFPGVVGALLRNSERTLAIAESCTGGRVGALITAVPGSSKYLLLDAVTYSNAAKEKILGVPHALLVEHGAVSEEVAMAMAEGVLRVADADLAVATTGIAGPDGGSDDKPVGTVWFALAQRNQKTITRMRKLPGDRERVQSLSAYIALELIRRALLGIHDPI